MSINSHLINQIRVSFEIAEVEAMVKDHRMGMSTYTKIRWIYDHTDHTVLSLIKA